MVSRMPPASPAWIMFVNSASKVRGCLRIASASDMPLSTSSRTFRIVAANLACGSWRPRMSRHCTSGRPASIITLNCRVKIARLLAGTLPPTLARALAARAFTGSIRVIRICSRRNDATAASSESACRSPLTFSPALVRPENANACICSPFKVGHRPAAFGLRQRLRPSASVSLQPVACSLPVGRRLFPTAAPARRARRCGSARRRARRRCRARSCPAVLPSSTRPTSPSRG